MEISQLQVGARVFHLVPTLCVGTRNILMEHNGSITAAAKVLHMDRSNLWRKVKQYGLVDEAQASGFYSVTTLALITLPIWVYYRQVFSRTP